MALPTYEELTSGQDQGQPGNEGQAGLPSYEDLVGGQPAPDPIRQATSEATAAAADNSWFSPEFRSGALFKEVLGPAYTAAQTAARVVGRAMGPLMETPVTTFKPGVQDYAATAQMGVPPQPPGTPGIAEVTAGIPPAAQEAIRKYGNISPPKELTPLIVPLPYLAGKYASTAARIFNPQGPPGAQLTRTVLEAGGGFLEKGSEAITGMITPLNIGISLAPELLPLRAASVANKGIALYFLAEAFKATPGQWERYQAAKTTKEKAGIVAETLVSYAPAAAFLHRSRTAAAARTAREEQPSSEPVGTTEVPGREITPSSEEFRGWIQTRLNDLTQSETELTPQQALEAKEIQDALAPGGDMNALAAKWQFDLSDVAPAEEPAAAAEPEGPKAGPREEEAAPTETATFTGKAEEHVPFTREEFIRAIKAHQDDLNAKTPLSDAEREELSAINTALHTGQIEALAKKWGITLTEGGEEVAAVKSSYAQVEEPPAPLGEQERAAGPEQAASSGDNVVGETEGKEPGGPVPQEAAPEPVVTQAAPAPKGTSLGDAIAAAEQSAAERDIGGAAVNLEEAERLLNTTKNLPKKVKEEARNRIAKVQETIWPKGKPPPTTAEADPNVVVYDGKTYHRTGEYKGTGIWKLNGRRKVGASGLNVALDNIWQGRKAITETAKEEAAAAKEKKAAPKLKTTVAPVPTTAPEVSREEIGKGEAQPAPGTKIKHWTWGEGEVVGPGVAGKTKVKFKDGRTMNFDTDDVVNKMVPKVEAPKAEEPPAKPHPAAELRKTIEDLQEKIIQDKTDALKLKGKERVAINKVIKKDQLALAKLKNKESTLPKAKPTPEEIDARTEAAISEREIFRQALRDRVKNEEFIKKDVVRPSSTGGQGQVVPSLSYRGLQIYKEPRANVKPWRVDHEGSGKPIGNFDSVAEAKAFAVRIHEAAVQKGGNFDFTRPWSQVVKQKTGFGTGDFQDLVNDPYSFLADAGARLKNKIDKDKTGAFMLNEDIGPDIREFGSRLYQRGMAFRDWAVNMVKHLGEKIVEHLRDLWDSITGRNLLPGRGERGGASPGGGSLKAQGGQRFKDFATRAEADAFIKANKFLSHSVIDQSGAGGSVRVNYVPKPAPGSGAAQPRPLVTKSGAIIQPRYNPAAAQAPAKVNSGTGGTIKPPPPGSALGPTPPGSNPHQVWYQRVLADWRKAWEWYHPGAYASTRLEPTTVAVNTHQKWIAGPANGIWNAIKSPWYAKLQRLSDQQFIDAEHDARYKYQALRAQGQGELQATLNAIKRNPLRDYFIHRMNEIVKEKAAAARLNVKMPGFIDGPYAPRLTDFHNKALIKIGGSREGVVTQLRRSLGHFDKSREHESMKDGIGNKVQYRNHMEAIIQRERVGEQLKATAQALDNLEKGGVIYHKRADAEAYARATYKPKDVDVIKMEGFGGDDWYIRNRQDARVIDQNLNNAGPNSQWGTFMRVVNNYARNPNLWNPAPHVTKNMFFKYVLARLNNLSLKGDTPEFKRMTEAEKIDLFHKVFTMPGDQPGTIRLAHSERVPEMIAGESKRWFDKITKQGLLLNRPSQKFIFEKADPYLRYKLWESYFRKGMHPQEAANNVLFDLIRYDENSGGLNLMKSIPFNFFSAWRTGTYVTIYKAMRTHPIRTLMFFGAVEYLREMIYRRTGEWTHLPIDYMFNPMAEVVESSIKAKREMKFGRSPVRAVGGVAQDTGAILLTTAIFGPGGSQAPTTIKDAMGALQGDDAAFARMSNMFWGLSQLFNIPGEYLAYQRDKKPQHLVNILTGAAFGTHSAIAYEPRRLGKYLFPESLPGMAYTPEMKRYAALREKAEGTAIKAATTHEQRYGIFRWANQGSRETQIEQLLRRAGVLKERRQPGGAAPSGLPRGGP